MYVSYYCIVCCYIPPLGEDEGERECSYVQLFCHKCHYMPCVYVQFIQQVIQHNKTSRCRKLHVNLMSTREFLDDKPKNIPGAHNSYQLSVWYASPLSRCSGWEENVMKKFREGKE